MNHPDISIHYARTPEEKAVVMSFVDGLYSSKYGTTPPTADIYTYATRNGVIVASFGLEFARDGLFQIERTYRIDRNLLEIPLREDNAVQLSRWASTDAYAGRLAILKAITYALDCGKVYGLAEHDDAIHRHCERSLGVKFIPIAHALVDLSTIPEANRPYYATSSMKPYVVDLKQIQESMSSYVKTH